MNEWTHFSSYLTYNISLENPAETYFDMKNAKVFQRKCLSASEIGACQTLSLDGIFLKKGWRRVKHPKFITINVELFLWAMNQFWSSDVSISNRNKNCSTFEEKKNELKKLTLSTRKKETLVRSFWKIRCLIFPAFSNSFW